MQKKAASHAHDSVSAHKPQPKPQSLSSLARSASASHGASGAPHVAPIVTLFARQGPSDEDSLFRGASRAPTHLRAASFPALGAVPIASRSQPSLRSEWRGLAKAHPALGGDALLGVGVSPAAQQARFGDANGSLMTKSDNSGQRRSGSNPGNPTSDKAAPLLNPGGQLRRASEPVQLLPLHSQSLSALRGELPAWEGALCPYTCYRTDAAGAELFGRVERALAAFRDEERDLDFEADPRRARASGRVHGRWDQSDFTVQVWRADARGGGDSGSVLEVRRFGGCCFVHDGFVRRLVARLHRGGAALRSAAPLALGAAPLAAATPADEEDSGLVPCAPAGPMDWDFDLDLEEPDVRPAGFEATEDGIASDSLVTPREAPDVEMKTVDPCERLKDLVEAATNRDCFREEYRNSVAQLCEMVQDEQCAKTVLRLETDAMAKLLKPLTCDLFDTFIILKVVHIVKHLVGCPGVTIGDNVVEYLKTLHKMWSGSPSHNLGTVTVTFPPSQQVVSAVKECLACAAQKL